MAAKKRGKVGNHGHGHYGLSRMTVRIWATSPLILNRMPEKAGLRPAGWSGAEEVLGLGLEEA